MIFISNFINLLSVILFNQVSRSFFINTAKYTIPIQYVYLVKRI